MVKKIPTLRGALKASTELLRSCCDCRDDSTLCAYCTQVKENERLLIFGATGLRAGLDDVTPHEAER